MGKYFFKILLFVFIAEFLVTTAGINFFIRKCHTDQTQYIIQDKNTSCESSHDTNTGCCSSEKHLIDENYSDLPSLNCCTDYHNYLKISSLYINSENLHGLNLLKNVLVTFNYLCSHELISGLSLNDISDTCYITKTGIKIILRLCKLTI